MQDVAKDTADDDNVKLLTAAGKSDIDNASQVAALEKMTSEGRRASSSRPPTRRRSSPRSRRPAAPASP